MLWHEYKKLVTNNHRAVEQRAALQLLSDLTDTKPKHYQRDTPSRVEPVMETHISVNVNVNCTFPALVVLRNNNHLVTVMLWSCCSYLIMSPRTERENYTSLEISSHLTDVKIQVPSAEFVSSSGKCFLSVFVFFVSEEV